MPEGGGVFDQVVPEGGFAYMPDMCIKRIFASVKTVGIPDPAKSQPPCWNQSDHTIYQPLNHSNLMKLALITGAFY